MHSELPALAQQLLKFPALKQLDVSANHGLQLFPIGFLQIAAELDSFKCDDCALLLPAQSFFSTPGDNPRRIQLLLEHAASEFDLSLSQPKDLEATADVLKTVLDSADMVFFSDVIEYMKIFWNHRQERASLLVQQLYVSLVSHKMSDSSSTLSLVEMFLDVNADRAADIMKWQDHGGRSAEANSMPKCRRAMLNRALFLGLYEIPVGLQHEYQSSTCTVYLADRVDDGCRMRVALKFMKNEDEFLREIKSRQELLAHSFQQQLTPQDCIVEAIESYPSAHVLFRASIQKRSDLVDYDNPCLLVMPAADRNLRAIMDSERITKGTVIKEMFYRILRCVKFMHDGGFIHGDIKPRNIVRSLRMLKIIDFDASALIGKQFAWSKHSSAYMPPESVRLTLFVHCTDFTVNELREPDQCTVFFNLSLPLDIPSNSVFSISIFPITMVAVHSLTLDDVVDLSSCFTIKDNVITVTANHAVVSGDRRFKIVASFHGDLPVATSMNARLQHDVNTLRLAEGLSKDSIAKCTVIVKKPKKDALSKQLHQQHTSSDCASYCAAQQMQSRHEVSCRILQRSSPTKRSSSVDVSLSLSCPPFLTDTAIDSISASMPPLQHSSCSLSPADAEAAAVLRHEYIQSATSVQRIMHSMRKVWLSLQQLSASYDPVISSFTQSFPIDSSGSSLDLETGSERCSDIESKHVTTRFNASSDWLERTARNTPLDVACKCACDIMLPPVMPSDDTPIRAACFGVCGLAHISHDTWALGIILYRMSARRSLWNEDDDDNIKDDSGHLMELALWTDQFKQQRLQNVEDTATRLLVSKLLEKDPRKRPSIDEILAMPFNEMDVVKLKLQQMVPHEVSRRSNLVGSVNDLVNDKNLRTGKFSDAAYGLRHYLKVADDWDERTACTLPGMQDEVDLLKDCPSCAQVQADVMQQLGSFEAALAQQLASALAELKSKRKHGAHHPAADRVKALRSEISAAGGWYYGLPNSISWPTECVKDGLKTFKQPLCQACKDYCLDYSSISSDLHYITDEPAVEEKFWNGTRDCGRAGCRLDYFMAQPQARDLLKEELIAMRFYTSHSYDCINIAMRDPNRTTPHPLPGMVTNIQRGLKKLRALGSDDICSKQTVVLWRGMSCMQLDQKFNDEGGTELAPMSTTADLSVAIGYAVKQDIRSALLFRFVTRNNLERGADVQWLSMFPGESETLFPPLTFLQRTRSEPQEVVHNGVRVTVVELSTTLA